MRKTCRDDAEHIDYPIQILRGQAQLKKEHGDVDKDQGLYNHRHSGNGFSGHVESDCCRNLRMAGAGSAPD